MDEVTEEDAFAEVLRQVEYELRDAAERLNYLLHTDRAKAPSVRREINVYLDSIVLLADMIGALKDTPTGTG